MRACAAALVCAVLLCVVCPRAAAQRGAQRVDILVQRYMDQRDAQKYDEALQTMLKARDLMPQDWDVWGFLGEAYFNKEMWVQSIEAFRKALDLGSDQAFDREKLAQALTYEGSARHENGADADAERLLLEAIRQDPTSADAHNNLAVVFQEQQRYEEARREYGRAIELAPDWSWARNNLGTLFQDLGELDQAAQKYREAIRLDPGYLPARTNLIWVLIPLGEFEEAERECRIVLEKGGRAPTTYCNLGRALASQGSFDEAERAYNDALKADPEYWDAQWALDGLADAMVEYSQKVAKTRNFEAAIAFCRKALGRDPGKGDALTWMAAYLRLQSPGTDSPTLEAKATGLVGEEAAPPLGAAISMVRAVQLPDGALVAAQLLRGESNLREVTRSLTGPDETGQSDEDALGLAFVGAFARADALLIGLEHGPSAEALTGAEYLLSNDLGASVPLDVEATNWLDNEFSSSVEAEPDYVPESLCFPLTDNKGGELLAAGASELVLSVSTREYGSLSLSWPLPVVESDLARQAGATLSLEDKQRYSFFTSQGLIDCARRTFVMRWSPEALLGMADEHEQAEMRRVAEGYVVAFFKVQGLSEEDLLWRVCLLGSDGAQHPGILAHELLPQPEYEAPPEEEAPLEERAAVEGEEAPAAEEAEIIEEPPPSEEAFLAFPLLTEDGQDVLSDDDGTIRLALLGRDGRTVQAVWEFPRRIQDVNLEQ